MEITTEELREKIKNGDKIVVNFKATWCGPCSMMRPIFEKVKNENTSEVGMYAMDVDKNRDLAIELGIRSVPTTKVFNGGNVVDTRIGMLQESQIKEIINNLIHG